MFKKFVAAIGTFVKIKQAAEAAEKSVDSMGHPTIPALKAKFEEIVADCKALFPKLKDLAVLIGELVSDIETNNADSAEVAK